MRVNPTSYTRIPGTSSTFSGSAVHVAGVNRGSPDSYLEGAIADTVKNSGMLDAVNPGDKVLILPATNSPDPYPATVHPLAVSTLVNQLSEVQVTIACTSGIEFVLPTPDGRVLKGTSTKCAEGSGLIKGGVEFMACENLGWNDGYYHFEDQRASHWPRGFHVSNLVQKADHVFVVSRLSTHGNAGITLGIKNLMGYLRMDSRVELHKAGPTFWFIRANACGSGIHSGKYSSQYKFPEMIAELGLAVQDKFRGQLLVGTELQTTMGPNAKLLEFPFGRQKKWFKLFKSYIHKPDTGLVIASKDIVASDAVAAAFLADAYVNHTPKWNKFWQWVLRRAHGRMDRLGKYGVYEDPIIAQALAIGLGNRVGALELYNVPAPLREMLEKAVMV